MAKMNSPSGAPAAEAKEMVQALPPGVTALAAERPFSLSNHDLHGMARLVKAVPPVISLPAEAWAYGISFPKISTPAGHELYLLSVDLTVPQGEVGLALMDSANAILSEILVPAAPHIQSAFLLATDIARTARLLIRNGQHATPSLAALHRADLWPVQINWPEFLSRNAHVTPVPNWNLRAYGYQGGFISDLRRYYWSRHAPFLYDWVDGIRLRLAPHEPISRALFTTGTYEPNTLCVMRRLITPGAVIFDVGANIGVVSLFAASCAGKNGKVYAFEPSAREFARLAGHRALNPDLPLEIQRLALADYTGHAQLRIADNKNCGLNTLGKNFAWEIGNPIATEEVSVTTLDTVAESLGLLRLDLVKMDIEGAEIAALKGGEKTLRRFRPALIVEAQDTALMQQDGSVAELCTWLTGLGYRLYSITEETAELQPLAHGTVPKGDNLVGLPAEA